MLYNWIIHESGKHGYRIIIYVRWKEYLHFLTEVRDNTYNVYVCTQLQVNIRHYTPHLISTDFNLHTRLFTYSSEKDIKFEIQDSSAHKYGMAIPILTTAR